MSACRVAQRRHEDRDHVEPEVQVLAELAARDRRRQILVGGGDHAHVDPDRCVPPTGSTTCSWSTRSTLACVFRLMSPISSRKSVPPSAASNSPLAIGHRAREGAAHVPEQLALDQLLGDGRAVHLDERPGASAAQGVDRAGHQLLARAVLAEDEHAAVGRRRHRDLFAQRGHLAAVADHGQPLIDPLAQRAVLRFEVALAHGVPHHQQGLLERQRLLDEVERAHLDRAHGRLDVAVAGDHHHLRVDLPLAQTLQRDQPVDPGQPDVEHDHVVAAAHHALETGLAAVDGVDVVALVAQDAAERASARRARRRPPGSSASVGSTAASATPRLPPRPRMLASRTADSARQLDRKPRPGGVFSPTSIVPPCSATMRRTMARPRPLPRFFVEKYGMKSLSRSAGGMPGPLSATHEPGEAVRPDRAGSRSLMRAAAAPWPRWRCRSG